MTAQMTLMTAPEAYKLIVAGQAPSGLQVRGRLDLSGSAVSELPPGLICDELIAHNTPLVTLPADLRVTYRLDLQGCVQLRALPDHLQVGTLVLRGCTALQALPDGLTVNFLDITGCTALEHLPERATLRHGNFLAGGCWRLRQLPTWVQRVAQLDVCGWDGLTALPPHLVVTSSLDIADTALTALPEGVRRARLLWRGVHVDARIVFQPHTITVAEVLGEPNAERRRVMIERMGYERFLQETQAEVLDSDTDPGGQRQLLRVGLDNDEPLVCLAVRCPSTGRHYMLRVPPTTTTCHQAAAWIAGFDNAADYQPLIET